VVVPRRLEQIELRYRPPGLREGLLAALLAAAILGVVAAAPPHWLRVTVLYRAALWAAIAGASAALILATSALARHRNAPSNAYARALDRWAWGTPPPEAMRALVGAAEPLLPPQECVVGLVGPWEGEEALFPPLWAAYFLPRCDVVPLPSAESEGPELRLVVGDAPSSDRLARVAELPGGGLYRRLP
jgi:hypothetical protein